jgi:hypothetical protein
MHARPALSLLLVMYSRSGEWVEEKEKGVKNCLVQGKKRFRINTDCA